MTSLLQGFYSWKTKTTHVVIESIQPTQLDGDFAYGDDGLLTFRPKECRPEYTEVFKDLYLPKPIPFATRFEFVSKKTKNMLIIEASLIEIEADNIQVT